MSRHPLRGRLRISAYQLTINPSHDDDGVHALCHDHPNHEDGDGIYDGVAKGGRSHHHHVARRTASLGCNTRPDEVRHRLVLRRNVRE